MFLKILFFAVVPIVLVVKGLGIWWWAGYVVVVLAYLHQVRVGRHVGAATNMVAAKITFAHLTEEVRQEVDRMAKTVMLACGESKEPMFTNEAQRYGWYAYSMRELGIPPVTLIPEWNVVKNPFDVPPRMWIDSVIERAIKLNGVEVEIDSTPARV